MPIIDALFLSLVAAVIIAVPACIAEFSGKTPNDVPLFVDVKTFWGHAFKPREVFWIGFLLHLLTAALFGALYYLATLKGIVRPYRLGDLLVYAGAFFVIVGALIFPIVGLGFFGRKEGKLVWIELLIVHLLLGFLIWLAVAVWPALKP